MPFHLLACGFLSANSLSSLFVELISLGKLTFFSYYFWELSVMVWFWPTTTFDLLPGLDVFREAGNWFLRAVMGVAGSSHLHS